MESFVHGVMTGLVCMGICWIGFALISAYRQWKAHGDCSQCKVWDCPYHECEKKRRELTK